LIPDAAIPAASSGKTEKKAFFPFCRLHYRNKELP